MRVAIAYYTDKNEKFIDLVKGIEKGIIKQGHQASIVNMQKDDSFLTMYNHIIFGCNCTSMFGGKIPDKFINKIKRSGMISGKYCSVFVDKKMGDSKTLSNLMKYLEKEGLILCASQILTTHDHAFKFGENLHIY